MLILSRKIGEAIAIEGDIKIRLLEDKGGQVKLGVEAPAHISVHREEVYQRILEENKKAASEAPENLDSLADLIKKRN